MTGKFETLEILQAGFERTLQLALSCFTIVLLAAAAHFAVTDRLGAAGVLMGIFVISVLTLSLPRLRAIEAFGIKANLDEVVRKAELTLEQFKRLTRSTARQGFQQVFRGELRDAPFDEKEAFIAALNDGMDAAGLDENERDALRRPLFEALAIDLMSPVQTVAVHLKTLRIREIEAALKGHEVTISGISDPNESRWVALRAEKQALMDQRTPDFDQLTTLENFSAQLDACAGPFSRTDEENRRLLAIIANAKRIMADCRDAKNVTSDSAEFLRFKVQIYPGVLHNDTTLERAEGILRSRFAEP